VFLISFLGTEPTTVWGQFGFDAFFLDTKERATWARGCAHDLLPVLHPDDGTPRGDKVKPCPSGDALMKTLSSLSGSLRLCGWAAEAGYRLDSSPHDSLDLISRHGGRAHLRQTTASAGHGLDSCATASYGAGPDRGARSRTTSCSPDKVGEPIRTVMPAGKQKRRVARPTFRWPRVRQRRLLYKLLRLFLCDAKTVTGWNNAVFENSPCRTRCGRCRASAPTTGEPQMDRDRERRQVACGIRCHGLRDLVNFLVYVASPPPSQAQGDRIVALFVLAILFVFTLSPEAGY